MTDLTIEREIVVDAPVAVVWQTITEPEQIAQWFADRVELDVRPGGDGTLLFDENASRQAVRARLVVEAVEPPHRFSFRWGHEEGQQPDPANSVLVEFTLTPEGDERTRVRVAETGLEAVVWADDDKARYADDHRNGWSTNLGRLAGMFASPAPPG
ncbi:MAG: SRPBCC domain-containing protein [Actinobacteria bacterium]|nr:SRPBCC domain-containing protein [Actinomycetota bacterium]